MNDTSLSEHNKCCVSLYRLGNQYILFVCLQVKYGWTEIRNLNGILDGIPDFGRTANDILESMFVQSLCMSLEG